MRWGCPAATANARNARMIVPRDSIPLVSLFFMEITSTSTNEYQIDLKFIDSCHRNSAYSGYALTFVIELIRDSPAVREAVAISETGIWD